MLPYLPRACLVLHSENTPVYHDEGIPRSTEGPPMGRRVRLWGEAVSAVLTPQVTVF